MGLVQLGQWLPLLLPLRCCLDCECKYVTVNAVGFLVSQLAWARQPARNNVCLHAPIVTAATAVPARGIA